MPAGAVVEYDPALTVHETGDAGRVYELTVLDTRTHWMIARVAEHGAILDNAAIRGAAFRSSDGFSLSIVNTFSDGTRLARMVIQVSELFDDMRISMQAWTSGVSMIDGSDTLELTREDFSDNGVAHVYFLISPDWTGGVCHHFHVYQGDELVGIR